MRNVRCIVSRILFASAMLALVTAMSSIQAAEDDKKSQPDDPLGKQHAAMTNTRLGELIRNIDAKSTGASGHWQLTINGVRLNVITDQRVDRMRIIAPVARDDALDQALMYRLLQANFDTALDARYSIAKGVLWSTYIHPLAALEDREFLSALGQVVNLVNSYGSSYSSGALVFRGGDSSELKQRKLIDQLLKKGLEI